MQDNPKPRYACPRCAAKLTMDFGHCPECGFIGPMVHKDIHLRATSATGVATTIDPLTLNGDAKSNQPQKLLDTRPNYRCPRCGTKTTIAYGQCPNHRSCGYVGLMQIGTIRKPKPGKNEKMSKP